MVSGYKVELVDEMKMDELIVDFHGPKDSPYVGVSKQIIAIKWYQRMKSFRRLMIYLKFYRVKQLNNPLYYHITLQERLLNILCLSSLLNSLNVI